MNTRLFDVALSALLLLLLAPLLVAWAIYARVKQGQVFSVEPVIGLNRRSFQRLHFAAAPFGAEWAVLLNILAGHMAFAGPRPVSAEAADLAHIGRFRPGLCSPYRLQQRLGIAYDDEVASDVAFFSAQTVRGNLGLIARALIAFLLAGDHRQAPPPSLRLFGIEISNTTLNDTLDWIAQRIHTVQPGFVAFMNPDCLNIVYRHQAYREALSHAALILPDGIGIKLACRILGIALKANVNGTDLFPKLCERAVTEGFSLYLLGAKPGIAEAVAENMQARYPGLKIAGCQHGFFAQEETDSIIQNINAANADILLVAFGAPKQELWLAQHQNHLTPPVRLGVGGLFDFYSGRIPRAPQWMREVGMEWSWRLLQEPSRMWRRYILGNPLFLYRIWRQKQLEERV
jgi:N-acetylglucosaminyldiphosphoundecaprenol N-acetyl-beta-D-mannosaminyltransferase